jgi:ribosome-associated protein
MTNADFDQLLGEPVGDWLVENVGIRERHFMAEDQSPRIWRSPPAQALERAGLEPKRSRSDHRRHRHAGLSQSGHGGGGASQAGRAPGRRVRREQRLRRLGHRAGCGGQDIVTEPDERFVLVIGAYGMSRFLDWSDKKTATLFADGAGAVVVGAGSRPGWLATVTAAAGEYHDALGIYTGGLAYRTGQPARHIWRNTVQAARAVRAQVPGHVQHRAVAAADRAPAGQGQRRDRHPLATGRCGSLLLHPSQPAHHRGHDGGARTAADQRPTGSWTSGATPVRPAFRWRWTTPLLKAKARNRDRWRCSAPAAAAFRWRRRCGGGGEPDQKTAPRRLKMRAMIIATPSIHIPEDELQFQFKLASGPGGQNVNKVATAAELRFDVARSPSLPDAVRARLRTLAGSRVNQNGELLITARRFRSQERNRQDAIERLIALIQQAATAPRPRVKTKPSRAAKQRRMDEKRHVGEKKQGRRSGGSSRIEE